ncbi:MAG: hypothetical protein ACE5KD_04490 [Candidatus Bathyarchaeia archaeon]
MSVIPIYRPYVFLRCRKCGTKTDHVLIEVNCNSEKREIEEIYECQGCGEIKRIYEFTTSLAHSPMQPKISQKEKEEQKDSKEVTTSKAPATQQPKEPIEQSKKQNTKKKHRFF